MISGGVAIRQSEALEKRMPRLRSAPRIYDYCYFAARTNLRVLLELVKHVGPGAVVVDIGCGSKPFARFFGESSQYFGFDWSSSRSADAVCDVSVGFPIKSGCADVVILSECLEHFPDPGKILSETVRILGEAGRLFVSTPFAFPIHGRPYDYYRFTEYFFRYAAAEYGLTIDRLEISNTSLVTPALDLQNIIMPTPLIPFMLKQIAFALINSMLLFPEWLCRRICALKPDARLSQYLRCAPVGYALIFTKNVSSPNTPRGKA